MTGYVTFIRKSLGVCVLLVLSWIANFLIELHGFTNKCSATNVQKTESSVFLSISRVFSLFYFDIDIYIFFVENNMNSVLR